MNKLLSAIPHLRLRTSSGTDFCILVVFGYKDKPAEASYRPFIIHNKHIYEIVHERSHIATGCPLNIQCCYRGDFTESAQTDTTSAPTVDIVETISTTSPITNITLVMPNGRQILPMTEFVNIKNPVFILPLTTLMVKQQNGTFYRVVSSVTDKLFNFYVIRQVGGDKILGNLSKFPPRIMLNQNWTFVYRQNGKWKRSRVKDQYIYEIIVELNPDMYPGF